ncbi:hypothetical protein [Oceanithermus sp.]
MITRRPHFRALALLVLALWFAPALAATPAGTVISNQAEARVGGVVYLSNPVETVVLPVCGVSVLPDGTPQAPGQSTNVTPGGAAYLAYQIQNTGNDNFTFDLFSLQSGASDWVPAATSIYLDGNHNAQVDPGEPRVQQLSLAAGETAWVVLEVQAPAQGSGDLLISLAASCPQGQADESNYARVSLVSGPALQVEKTFSLDQVEPGGRVHVSLVVRNVGDQSTGGEVVLSDDLSGLTGLSYVSGSAVAAKGVVEFASGSGWQAVEPAGVTAIRLRLAGLEAGETAQLDFDLRAAADAAPQTLENVAVAEGPGGPAQAAAFIEIPPRYEFHLGPGGNPRALPGGEGSNDDAQSSSLITGQPQCFAHTLENASNVTDEFTLSAAGLPDGVTAVFRTPDGAPLSLPLLLDAGTSRDFLYCLTASGETDPFTVTLTATSVATGEQNLTYDRVIRVLASSDLQLVKSASPEGTVEAGSELTYTLTVHNGLPIAVTNVTVTDVLSTFVEYVSSAPAGAYDDAAHQVSWQIASLPAGGEWQAKLVVRVKENTPDDTVVSNAFSLTADQFPVPVSSDPVENPVWTTSLLLQKEVDPSEVKIGDRLRYTLKVSNPSTAALVVTLTDTPPAHLAYVPGSGEPRDPELVEGRLVWDDLEIGAGETVTLSYQMRVLAGAPSKLVNVAEAKGVSTGGAVVASSQATASVKVVEEVFLSRKATIVGRVYLDVDKNGRYDFGRDVPLPGARLLLADGRQVLTDAYGNYAFRDLEAGVWLLSLDLATAPFPPLPQPEALGDGQRHRVSAWGLTVSDFPLEAPAGTIRAVRKTALYMGPLKLEKQLIPLGEGRFRVVLHLQSSEALPDLKVRDPLPGGDEKVFEFARFSGDKTVTYDLEGKPVMTDPQVRWRYP